MVQTLDQTLAQMMTHGAELNSSSMLAFAGPEHVNVSTVGAVGELSQRIAGALQGLGIGPGDVVAVQLPATQEGAVAQAAVALSGAALLPIVMIYEARELNFILRQSRAKAIVVPTHFRGRDHLGLIRELRDLPDLKHVIVVGEQVPDEFVSFADLLGRKAKPYTVPQLDPDDRAMLVYTSGTTADPKGVQHTHRTLLNEVRSLAPGPDAEPARHLALFPPGHVAGLLGLLRVLLLGIPTVAQEAWDAGRAAALIDEFELTYCGGAPVQLSGILDQKENGAYRLDSLREFMTGAAAVPPNLIYRADRLGISAYRCYGSSEHPTISIGTVDDPLDKRANTDGRIIAGSEVRLIDDEGNDVPEGMTGEIASRGVELFIGYTDPALNAAAFLPGGWFRTGDIGRLDADGYLTLTDRKKDIIIRGGENISAKEVEDILSTLPGVAEVAVVGYPDPLLGERVCAAVVLRSGRSLELDEVREHFGHARAARQKTPERLEILDAFPRTPAGKIQKHLIRASLS